MTTIELSNTFGEATFCVELRLKEDVVILRKKVTKPEWGETPRSQVKIIITDKEAQKLVAPVMKELIEIVSSCEDEEERDVIRETFIWDEANNTITVYEHCGYVWLRIK